MNFKKRKSQKLRRFIQNEIFSFTEERNTDLFESSLKPKKETYDKVIVNIDIDQKILHEPKTVMYHMNN